MITRANSVVTTSEPCVQRRTARLMMRTFVCVLILILNTSLAMDTANANEGPHGGYSLTTSNCAACHRPHTATGSKLLRGDGVDTTLGNGTNYDIADFCFSCHKDGAGANNNVHGGYYMGYAGPGDAGSSLDPYSNPWPNESTNTSQYGSKNAGLNGGGFVSAKRYWGAPEKLTYNGRTKRGVTWTDPVGGTHFNHQATGEAATSSYHNALDDTKTWTVWGSLMAGSSATVAVGPGMVVTLKCTSCHDQHGSSQYRILRDSRSDSNIGALIPGYVVQRDYLGAPITTLYQPIDDPVQSWEREFSGGSALTKDYTSYSYKVSGPTARTNISDFCKRCHSQYYAVFWLGWSYASYDAGDGLGATQRFRHQTSERLTFCPGKCPGGICGAYNLNRWIQLPLATSSGVVDGVRNGRPVYESDINNADFMVCTTCHQAHGTSVIADQAAQVGPTKYAQGSDPGHTNLLRLDNRGICEDCHGWTALKDENSEPCPVQYDPASCADPIGP